MPDSTTLLIRFQQMEQQFEKTLKNYGFTQENANRCAHIFAENTLDGVFSHGINRFPRFIKYIQAGAIDVSAKATLKHTAGAIEQWDGQLGPGPLNALDCTDRTMELAHLHGLGCVALANTNHWMRGGTYGWRAAKAGFTFIAWTNTTPNMPAWGARECRLGNNPLILAVPFNDEAIVLDMAMSQFSYGRMERDVLKNQQLPLAGGYDENEALTTDPNAILKTMRPLPMGYWKGAGLALLLDVLAVVLSGGLASYEVGKNKLESGVSQVFIAVDHKKLNHHQRIADMVENIITDFHAAEPGDVNKNVRFPGERVMQDREKHLQHGIPVEKQLWDEILQL